MQLGVVGLNHKTAPVEIREKVAVTSAALPDRLKILLHLPSLEEGVLLSTCNRTEVYLASPEPLVNLVPRLYTFFQPRGVADDFMAYCYQYENGQAVDHLLRVAAGLDSMILGESQIIGQVKKAFQTAQGMGGTGAFLNPLFNRALHTGGRVRGETRIGERAVSVSHAAVELARKILGKQLKSHRVLLVGAGKMGKLSAKLLAKFGGVAECLVANRSMVRAKHLAQALQAEAVPFEAIPEHLGQVDVVITSTSSPQPIISAAWVQAAMIQRKGRPLFLIDISVPRDVDPRVAALDNVFLYDVDDLKSVVLGNFRDREREIPKVEKIIDEEAQRFWKWYASRQALQVAASFRDAAAEVRARELARVFAQAPPLKEKEQRAFEQFCQRLQ